MTEDEILERINDLDAEVLKSPRINWPVLLVMILACLATGLIAVTLPFARNASNTSDDLARSNQITGCRAQRNADVVDATAELNRQRIRNDLLLNSFLDALLNDDQDTIESLRPQFAPIREALAGADRALVTANDAYQMAVDLSVSDPDKFLSECTNPRLTSTTTAPFSPVTGIQPETTSTTAKAPTRPRPRPRATTTTAGTTTTTFRSSPRPTPTPTTCLLPSPFPCL